MKLSSATKLAAVGAVSLAAVLTSALPSTAAGTAVSSSESVDPVLPIEVKRFDPDAGATQSIHTFACPPSHPWLDAATSGWGLRGIEVDGDGYAAGDVTVDVRPMRDLQKLAVGWDGTATAVNIHRPHDDDFAVVANCTNDRAAAYPG